MVKVMLYPGSTLTTQEQDSKCGKPLPGDWLMMTPVEAVRISFMGQVTVDGDKETKKKLINLKKKKKNE